MTSPLAPRLPEDRTNPYAAPESEIGPGQHAGFGSSPTPFAVGEVMSRAWQIFKAQMWRCIPIVMFYVALQAGVQAVFYILESLVPPDANRPSLATLILAGLILFQLWIGIGLAIFMLRIARGQDASFGDVFRGGPYMLPVIFSTLVYMLVLAGVVALGMIPGYVAMSLTGGDPVAGAIVFAVGFLVAMIAGIVLGIRLSLYYYLVIDRGAGIMESLRLSHEITRGNVVDIIAIGLLTILINVAGLLACGVGLIFTIPYSYLLFPSVVYLALTGQPIADPLARGKPAPDAGGLGSDGPVSDSF